MQSAIKWANTNNLWEIQEPTLNLKYFMLRWGKLSEEVEDKPPGPGEGSVGEELAAWAWKSTPASSAPT